MGILRILLALAVVVGHVSNVSLLRMMNGQEAVQIFFVISGFYISLILSKKYDDLYLFYTNRFMRLYPAYALVLAAAIAWFLVYRVAYGHFGTAAWIPRADAEMSLWQWLALQFSNFTMIGLDVPALFHWKGGQGFLFMHGLESLATPDGAEWAGGFNWISQAWSIGGEIWFYMLAPFIVRRGVGVQIALATASLGLMIAMHLAGFNVYFFFPANLWLFVGGSLLFRASRSRYLATPDAAGYVALAYIFVAAFGVGAVADPALHILMLLGIALCIPFLSATFSRFAWDAAIGNLSYPLYLCHVLTIHIFASVFHAVPAGPVLGFSLLVATGIAHFVDEPIDRLRQRRVLARATVAADEARRQILAPSREVAASNLLHFPRGSA